MRLKWLLKSSKHTNKIPAEFTTTGGRKIRFEINKLVNYIWNEEELAEEWKKSIILRIYKKGDKTDCNNYRSISLCQMRTNFYPKFCCQG